MRPPVQNAPLGNLEPNQLRMSFGKRADRQGLRARKQTRNLLRRFQLRIDNHRQPQLLAQVRQLLAVIRIANTRNRCQSTACLFRNGAAEQIQLIRTRDGNHQIRLLQACFHQDPKACAVALNAHHIKSVCRIADNALARINDCHVVSFANQLLCQRMPNLAAAHNDNAQTLSLLFRSLCLHDAFPPLPQIAARRYNFNLIISPVPCSVNAPSLFADFPRFFSTPQKEQKQTRGIYASQFILLDIPLCFLLYFL